VPFGTPFIAASRSTFEQNRIIALTQTPLDGIRDDIKALLHAY
jgi:hypothetical protein